MRHPKVLRDPTTPTDMPPPVISKTMIEKTPPFSQPLNPHHKVKELLDLQHPSPPPILLSSLAGYPSPNSIAPNPEHAKLVSQVTVALDEGSMEDDNDQDDEASNESDDQISEEEEPDDLMTSDQYQEEAQRVALIRKGSILDVESQKKRRLEMGETNHP